MRAPFSYKLLFKLKGHVAIPFQKKWAAPRTDSSITSPATIKIKILLLGFYHDGRDESNGNVFLPNRNPGGLQIPEKQLHTLEIRSKSSNRQNNPRSTGKKG